MKIAISAVQPSIDSELDPWFGRCRFFILIDSETLEWQGFENRDAMAFSAGVGAAQFVASLGTKAVLTGGVGPQAAQVLLAAGIEIVSMNGGSVREALDAFQNGRLRGAQPGSPPAQVVL